MEQNAFDRLFQQPAVRPTSFYLRPRTARIHSQNLVHKLRRWERQLNAPNAGIGNRRKAYLNIYPKKTHYQVEDEVQMVAVRKFSPCGRYLVAFSRSTGIHSLEVYRLRAGVRGKHLDGSDADTDEMQDGIHGVWSRYFTKHFSAILAQGPDTLNKDFCLFTPNSRYVIVASSQPPAFSVHHVQPPDTLKTIPNLEDISIYVVDMLHGSVAAKQTFPSDCISLSHSVGISLDGNRLAVLSLLRQHIQMFTIRDDGSLLHLMTIGEACHADDALFKARTSPWLSQPATPPEIPFPTSLAAILEVGPPVEEERPVHAFIGGLKHRLLVALFRQAKAEGNYSAQLRFFDRFDEYSALALLKMQILDDRHLLLKYGSPENASNRCPDPSGCFALLVIYNYVTTDVVTVFTNSDERLLALYEELTDYFRPGAPNSPSPMNSAHTRDHFRRTLQSIRAARNGGMDQAVRRGLGSLPMSSQTFRESPYFDLGLFSYDEKIISHSDRVKQCGDFAVKFYSRVHGGMVFSIPTGPKTVVRSSRAKKLASYVFHPYLPLAITIQHTIQQTGIATSNTNIHYRP